MKHSKRKRIGLKIILEIGLWNILSGVWKKKKKGMRQWITGASQVALGIKNLPANAGDIRDASSVPGSG